ncbi:hypothetical protein PG996_012215 [Apiospora saccharicola]|uniref:Heterokaryon incompatibility domain-containing protein n=1 Tax=Apiospora saccharicola TaxID=335842 RepID=A0ABR1U1Y0_9PEZI
MSSRLFCRVENIDRVFGSDLQPDPRSEPDSILRPSDDFTTGYQTDPINQKRYLKFFNIEERTQRIALLADRLYTAASRPETHTSELDAVFDDLYICRFWLGPDQDYRRTIVTGAFSFLERLPAHVPQLPEPLDNVSNSYFRGGCRDWNHLQAVSIAHKNLIRVALDLNNGRKVALGGEHQKVLNFVGKLLDYISSKPLTEEPTSAQAIWFIVRSYLWSFWYRARTAQIVSYIIAHSKSFSLDGWNVNFDNYCDQADFSPAPNTRLSKLSWQLSEAGMGRNVCRWAFQILRTHPMTFGMDFRLFHARYNSVLGQETTRCVKNSESACDGADPRHCLRFHGFKVKMQSAHDFLCGSIPNSETRIEWDEASYRSVAGPRAVQLDTEGIKLSYRLATAETLTISHVWLHGQGGRPETGLNQCLHTRYCRIATALGCDSYWMDAACIPSEHKLRREAITQINAVFSQSRVVLVCDKDIMKIDVTHLTVEVKESLLVAVILSDWNARAWTLLESMKGRQNIHLLCKDNKTVEFGKILMDIIDHGHFEIIVFIWHVYHMLPSNENTRSRPKALEHREKLTISTIGTLLSYRPASRKGDDFVIWSLLIDPERDPTDRSDAKAFWKSQIGRAINTGYLMSSLPRLKSKGLGWAPISPYLARKQLPSGTGLAKIKSFDRTDTALGEITAAGLWGVWRKYDIPRKGLWRRSPAESSADREFERIRSKYLRPFSFGALLRPVAYDERDVEEAPQDPGYSEEGTMFVVCESYNKTVVTHRTGDESYRWTWKGVHIWPRNVPLPKLPPSSDSGAYVDEQIFIS